MDTIAKAQVYIAQGAMTVFTNRNNKMQLAQHSGMFSYTVK